MMKKNAMRRTVSAFLLGMVCLTAVAQGKKVTGVITDSKGEPLIGASVKIKGSAKGVITDIDGKYVLPGAKNGDVLVVSYIGCEPQELKVGATNNYNVQLHDNSQDLNELVVIGYGTVQKKDLTGSVATLSADDISSVPVSSVTEAMAGKMAGVNITATEGSPDADIKIRVRGGGSLSQDNSPLYIVDGFPVSSISDIAPSEIQSIDVLKDASSTAIYGARGANGVIIITTKSGKEGKVKVDFGAYYGFRKVTKLQKMLSPYDYAYYQYEALNGNGDFYGNYNDLEIWKSVEGTDYQDEIFGRTGNQANYNVNVSGGSKTLKFNVSYAHNDEKSIMLNSGYHKDNVNAKLNATLNDWLSLDFNARLSYTSITGLSGGADQNESSSTTSIVANSARWRPIEPLVASGGDDDEGASNRKTPLQRLVATDKQQPRFNQTYNVGLNWTPFKNWTFRSEFGYTWKFEEVNQVWLSDATQYAREYAGQAQADYLRTNKKNWRNANTLTYDNKKLFNGRDRINVLIGHEVSSSWSTAVENKSVNFPTTMTIDEIKANMAAGTALPTQSTISAKDNMLSFFGRVNYTMMDKYLLTVTMRADGSSKFAEGNQWGLFPSAALAWRLSDEKFMQHAKSWLSNLKVRLSYGTAGNNRINSGLIYPTYTMASSGRVPYFNETLGTMIQFGDNLYNPNLKWETTITRNLGFDYGFWNNRVSGSLDFYWNTTKDLLMRTTIPANTGFGYQYQNFGQTSNKGVEFTLNALLVNKKNASLNFTFNVSYNKGKIDDLAIDNPWQDSEWAGSYLRPYQNFRVEKGGRLGEVWGYKTAGFFTPYDAQKNPNGELILDGTTWKLREGIQDKSSTLTGGQLYPGGLKVEVDENGDPVKQRLGNTIAPVTGGFGFNGNVGGFDFNIFCNYSVGNKIINGSKLMTSFFNNTEAGYNLNSEFAVGNRYTWIDPATGQNLGKGLSSTVLEMYGGAANIVDRLLEINNGVAMYNPAAVTKMQLTDYALEDASFLRINNVTIGYTLPRKWIKKCFMESVRIYFTGYNLACFTKYSGSDPEVDTMSKKNAMNVGIDYSAYPKSRSFVGGINISF